tara:strand:+ start:25242 stop:25610 length:369 start_codon:yes stop_codon:yes gene_type:complete
VKGIYKLVGVFLFLSLYLSAIAPTFATKEKSFDQSENSFKQKEYQLSVSSNESVFSPVESVSDNFQNTFSPVVKKLSHEYLLGNHLRLSKENSKFKQYIESWHNQLIISKNTDQLYPQHTFG